MVDHEMCSFLTRTFLLVHDADKCPAHGPEFFVVVTVIAARRAYWVDHISWKKSSQASGLYKFQSST